MYIKLSYFLHSRPPCKIQHLDALSIQDCIENLLAHFKLNCNISQKYLMCLLCYKLSYFSYKYLNMYCYDQVSHNLVTASVSSVAHHIQLFAIPWTAALQASLSFTNSRSLLKLMSTESVMPSNHLILCCHFPASSLSLHQVHFQ